MKELIQIGLSFKAFKPQIGSDLEAIIKAYFEKLGIRSNFNICDYDLGGDDKKDIHLVTIEIDDTLNDFLRKIKNK